jgi:DNA-binding MarR family transcriptional regulator
MAEPTRSPGELDTLVDGLAALSRVLVGVTARTLAMLDVDITLSQYRTIVLLAARGPQRTVDLAGALGLHPSTVTRTCDRLIRRGLVDRRHRPPDRRVAWLLLTESGRELVGDVMRRRTELLRELVAACPHGPVGPLVELIDGVVAAAGEPSEARWWRHWAESTKSYS